MNSNINPFYFCGFAEINNEYILLDSTGEILLMLE